MPEVELGCVCVWNRDRRNREKGDRDIERKRREELIPTLTPSPAPRGVPRGPDPPPLLSLPLSLPPGSRPVPGAPSRSLCLRTLALNQ